MVAIIVLSVIIVVAYLIPESHGISDNGDLELFTKATDDAEFIPYSQFISYLINGDVNRVYYKTDDEQIVFILYTDETRSMTADERKDVTYTVEDCKRTYYTADSDFRKNILIYDTDLILVRVSNGSVILANFIAALPSLMFMTVLICTLIWMQQRQTNDFRSEDVIRTSDVTFDSIIGHEELTEEFQLIVNLIKDKKFGDSIGIKPPTGILLSGVPGTGKTLIAKAIAHESGVNFLSVSGSDFQEIFVGNGARHVRQIFKIARQNTPCIVFIDEFDAIGQRRDARDSSSEDGRTINAVLKELDGFTERTGIFVLAATNYPDKLDPAVTRSGRFDREIVISPPKNWETRKELFELYLKDKKVDETVDLDTIAKSTTGFTGADVKTVCNEAGLVALSKGHVYISHDDIEEAIDKKIFKGSRTKKKTNDKDRRTVAYHEASHAIVSLYHGLPVSRATIASTTSGVGGAVIGEDSDSSLHTREYFIHNIHVAYAGRVGEEILLDNITTGASNDIEKATEYIKQMINVYGFDVDSSGIIYLNKEYDVYDKYTIQRMRELSLEFYKQTRYIVSQNKEAITALAERLLECETLKGFEIEEEFSNLVVRD